MAGDETGPDSPTTSADLRSVVGERLRAADGLLFCTDFDGTLAAIEADPDAAVIAPEKREFLRTLRDHAGVHVAVISGRGLADLRERVGVSGIDYAGNHGLELHLDGETTVHPVAQKREHDLEAIVAEIEAELADTDCFVEDKAVSATVHYREAPEDETLVHDVVETAAERVAPGGFDLSTGKAIVELTPAVEWDKGHVVSLLAEDFPGYLTAYIGDDTTDETVFEAFSGDEVGVHVGAGESAAAHRLADPEAVASFLDWLTTAGFAALDEDGAND